MKALQNLMSGMKTVFSAGRQVSFRLPKQWQQEPDGNGVMFYIPEPDSGALQLNVLTLHNPVATPDDPPEVADWAAEFGVPLETLASGAYLVRSQKLCEEEGDALSIESWYLEVSEGEEIVIAIFTFTLLEDQIQVAKYREQIEMLDREIRQSVMQI